MVTRDLSAWIRSLDAHALAEYRFELYDRLEASASDSEAHRDARIALIFVAAAENRLRTVEWVRNATAAATVTVELADWIDPVAFADALVALADMQRAVGRRDTVGLFEGALEVAARRANLDEGSSDDD
jgi:hypothetical protein